MAPADAFRIRQIQVLHDGLRAVSIVVAGMARNCIA